MTDDIEVCVSDFIKTHKRPPVNLVCGPEIRRALLRAIETSRAPIVTFERSPDGAFYYFGMLVSHGDVKGIHLS